MKSINTTLSFLFVLTFNFCAGQNETEPSKQTSSPSYMAVGFSLNQFQHDFGLGLNVTSPYIIHKRIALRISGNLQWLQSISPATATTTWNNYQTYKIGITGISGYITKGVRAYGEGGFAMIVPNKIFSDKSSVLGGYGLFGFEFFFTKAFNYFIELGGIGTDATAEKALFKPIYSNGFTTSVGFRARL